MDNNSIEKDYQTQKESYLQANVDKLSPDEQKQHFVILMSERPWMHKTYVKSYMEAMHLTEAEAIAFIKDVHGDGKDKFTRQLREERIKDAMQKHNMSYANAFYFVASEDRVLRDEERKSLEMPVEPSNMRIRVKYNEGQTVGATAEQLPTAPQQPAPQPITTNNQKAYLKCKKCGETQRISVQAISGLKRRSCMGTAILSICTCGIYLIYMIVKGRKNMTTSTATCQNCGNTWTV